MNLKERNSNIELLRCIAAIMILFNHIVIEYEVMPGFSSVEATNMMFRNLFYCGGKTGAMIFVIIGAWFLTECDKIKMKNIFRIVVEVFFYGVLLNLVYIILGYELSFGQFLKGFNYWFPFGYVVMLLVIPYINTKMTEKLQRNIIVIGLFFSIIFFVFSSIVGIDNLVVKIINKGVIIGPTWFIYIYILTAYIKKNDLFANLERKTLFWVSLGSYVLMFIILCWGQNLFIRDITSPLSILFAFSTFGLFNKIEMKNRKWINKIAACTFATYLFSEQGNLRIMREDILFDFEKIGHMYWFIFYCIFAVLVVFIITFLLNIIFEKIFKRAIVLAQINR